MLRLLCDFRRIERAVAPLSARRQRRRCLAGGEIRRQWLSGEVLSPRLTVGKIDVGNDRLAGIRVYSQKLPRRWNQTSETHRDFFAGIAGVPIVTDEFSR